jgi:hypothetical protein
LIHHLNKTSSTNINPISTTTGFTFTTPNPQIRVTLDRPTTLTLIYLPVDRPNQPSNVQQFQVVFVYPTGSPSPSFTSTIPSTNDITTLTTTPSAGTTPPIFTTPRAITIVPPSNVSSQVDLPPNFQVPQNTVVEITITSTINGSNPTGVCECFFSQSSLISRSYISCFWKHIMSENEKREKDSDK